MESIPQVMATISTEGVSQLTYQTFVFPTYMQNDYLLIIFNPG